ncbi:MAG TPA: PEPxxWA-CTERM sorting domain-containing protein [Phenylobacterium sp.]|jgi:hypothetical protein
MQRISTFAVAAAALSMLAAGSATQAAVQVATYTGIIMSGTDDRSLFGGGDLTGDHFTAVLTYDTSIGLRGQDHNHPAYDDLKNATFPVAFPLISTEFTVNGHTFDFFSDTFAQVRTGDAGTIGFALHGDQAGPIEFRAAILLIARAAHLPTDLDKGFDGDTGGETFGNFNIRNEDFTPPDHGPYDITQGVLRTLHYHVTGPIDPIGTPEPATWALMLTGFGLAGAGLRRRRGALAA